MSWYPAATAIAVLVNPTTPTIAETYTRELQTAARTFGLSSTSCTRAPNATSIRPSQP